MPIKPIASTIFPAAPWSEIYCFDCREDKSSPAYVSHECGHGLLGIPSEEAKFKATICGMIYKAAQINDREALMEILRMHAKVMHLAPGVC